MPSRSFLVIYFELGDKMYNKTKDEITNKIYIN